MNTGLFRLAIFMPRRYAPVGTAYIYIEGDGLAWLDRETPSPDPTPRNPVALKLALRQGEGAAAIGRPCQYVTSNACGDNGWWTNQRYAPEIIAATDAAIDVIEHRYGARRVVLIGYSGGGAVAALVAARRRDVAELVTVAGNLDTGAWTRLQGVSPLAGSLNPADDWAALQDIPQRHFVGAQDKIVPVSVAQSYADRFPAAKRPSIVVMDGYDHSCCWADHWPPAGLVK